MSDSQPLSLEVISRAILHLPSSWDLSKATDPPFGTATTNGDPKMLIQPPWSKRKINIILIGETGVGKTAFLNFLANVCSGVELQGFKEMHVVRNEQGGSESGSQTNKPYLYKIACANGHEVNVLDTPGLADTRGIDKDNEHKEAIANAIKDNIEVVDAIVILANGTLARLGVATEYTLNIISGMFPHSIVNNIAFVFTMVTDPTSFNFERASLPPQLKHAKLWCINNPFAQWMKYQQKKGQFDEDILEEMEDSVRRSYKKSLKTLSQLFQYLDGCEAQPSHGIYHLYTMSIDIEAAISNVIARMDQAEAQRSQLQRLRNDKDVHDQASMYFPYTSLIIVLPALQSKRINAKFEGIIQTPMHEHEGTADQHNTLCIAAGCYSNCHTGCQVGFTMDRKTLGDKCCAFKGLEPRAGLKSRCIECGHLAEDHQHYRSKWAKKIKTGITVDENAKRRYQLAKSEAERISIVMEEVEKRIKELEQGIVDLEHELSDLCDRYNDLALSGSFVGYICSAIRLLKIREQTMKKEGASSDALDRMAERIKSMENKKNVVEEAERVKWTWKAGFQAVAGRVFGLVG